ncbi:MAG TPA: conjugal transfer protein TraX [Clostridia bacterium]|jgi:hypothetical protein|nr:conjugal transfer protein TraX [Clostridia bacterium]
MFEIIAMLTMFIDHLGVVFFPEQIWFRIIGRIAMPLYTYGIVQGYKYTSNFKKYLFRLFCIALASQIFYKPLFDTARLNIVFTFLVCLLLLKCLDQTKSNLKYLFVTLVACYLEILNFEYGLYAFVLMLIYHFNQKIIWRHNLLNLLYFFLRNWQIQLFSFLPTILIEKYKNRPLKGTARLFYRAFYPLHLALLLLISKAI